VLTLPIFNPLGDRAVLMDFENAGEGGAETTAKIAALISRRKLVGVLDVVPAFSRISIHYDPVLLAGDRKQSPYDRIVTDLQKLLNEKNSLALPIESREFRIPVCYDTKFGLDLTDLAKSRGLSVDEVIDMHCTPTYVVGAIGFAPGFPYLEGINPKLIVPRRANPRVRVPAGSVAVAANYTGIYPSALPGGWHIIGRTNTSLFSFEDNGGALLRVGDRVSFNRISREEFDDTNPSDRKTSEK